MERRGEFAAASLQTESYLEREHNARWTVLGVGYATRGITANVLTLLFPPQTFLRATSSILTYKLRGAKTILRCVPSVRPSWSLNAKTYRLGLLGQTMYGLEGCPLTHTCATKG